MLMAGLTGLKVSEPLRSIPIVFLDNHDGDGTTSGVS